MSTSRSGHGVAVAGGKMYAGGGADATDTMLSSVECFNPSTGQWSVVAAMNTARYGHGVAVAGGKMYAMGGSDDADTHLSSVECFDPSTGQWSIMVGGMSTARAFCAVVAMECPAE